VIAFPLWFLFACNCSLIQPVSLCCCSTKWTSHEWLKSAACFVIIDVFPKVFTCVFSQLQQDSHFSPIWNRALSTVSRGIFLGLRMFKYLAFNGLGQKNQSSFCDLLKCGKSDFFLILLGLPATLGSFNGLVRTVNKRFDTIAENSPLTGHQNNHQLYQHHHRFSSPGQERGKRCRTSNETDSH
jgi:hypothetical protein